MAGPERDWRKASALDIARAAASNLPSSAARDVGQMVQPIIDIVHPSQWGKYAKAAKDLAIGAGSKINGALGEPQDAKTKAANEAAINAVGHYYAQRYLAPGGLQKTLATDPFGAAMDAGAVLSIPAGGEGLAAKVPGVAGQVARTAAKTARVASEVTNPIVVAGKGVSATARLAKRAVQGAILDGTGAFSPAVKTAVAKAFPNGMIGADELADPAFKSVLSATLSQKGITPQAVREAVLAYHDAPTPKSAVTLKAPPKSVASTVQDLTAQGKSRVGQAAQAVSGAPEPSATELGSAIEQAQIDAHNQMHTQYRTAFAHPGEYDPAALNDLHSSLASALKSDHLPATPEEIAKYPSLVQTGRAYDWLSGHLNDLAQSNDLTMPNLERTRQELNQFRRAAEGTDSRAMGAIIDGFDRHLQDAAADGLFSGGPEAATDMQTARRGFKDYQSAFNNRDNPVHSAVTQAVKHLAPDQATDAATGLITAPAAAGSAEAAQGVLARKLINPRTLEVPPGGEKLYGKLSDIMGPDNKAALDDFLRQSVLATDENGHLIANGSKLQNFLTSPLAGEVFTPGELSKVRLMGAANDVLSATPRNTMDVSLGETLGHTTRSLAGAGVGAVMSHGLGINTEMGALMGGGLEQTLEPLRGLRLKAAEAAGAPATLKPLRTLDTLGQATAKIGAAAPAAFETTTAEKVAAPEPDPWAKYVTPETASPTPGPKPEPDDPWAQYVTPPDQQWTGGRVGRASGGKVDSGRVEELVGQLMARSERAKKVEKAVTKPLLDAPDEAVVKALAVAQNAL